jgi:thiol-disulfide isomerase/thioredoxin
MKSIILLLIAVFISVNLSAQLIWLGKLDRAKEVALELNKLIVIDFGASWCAPCRTMEQMVWESSELSELSKNFVPLKIDVDHDKITPGLYSVSGIPKVVLATASGLPIWMSTGFSTAAPYLDILRAIPTNVGELNKCSLAFEKDKKDLKANMDLALSLQNVGKEVKNENLKSKFLERSNYLFGKVQKLSKDAALSQEAELYAVLNILYYGKPEKALKKMDNIAPTPENEKIEDLRHYVLAKCYWETKNQDNFIKEKNLIKSKEILSHLE